MLGALGFTMSAVRPERSAAAAAAAGAEWWADYTRGNAFAAAQNVDNAAAVVAVSGVAKAERK